MKWEMIEPGYYAEKTEGCAELLQEMVYRDGKWQWTWIGSVWRRYDMDPSGARRPRTAFFPTLKEAIEKSKWWAKSKGRKSK